MPLKLSESVDHGCGRIVCFSQGLISWIDLYFWHQVQVGTLLLLDCVVFEQFILKMKFSLNS